METDFNLSEKINIDCEFNPKQWIEIYYIKEFIKRLKEDCSTFQSAGAICSVINNLAGDKLI